MRKIISILMLFLLFFASLPSPNIYASEDNKKIIYLTFDDGPGGKVTEDTLDILKKEKVHATFFLIGAQIEGQEELVKRINDEGHAIGLHSMTHEKCKLYADNNLFLKEMLTERDLLKELLNKDINILRFPFGSNNYSYKLTQSLVDLLHENNLRIYDWNVDSTDGANANGAPYTFVKNATNNKDKSTVVLLMHCGFCNKNSPIALPEVIKYYKENGYEFKTIDNKTPELYHILNK